ncbi:MAG: methyl-accepting chemotaxis protein [Acetivibrio sp.]
MKIEREKFKRSKVNLSKRITLLILPLLLLAVVSTVMLSVLKMEGKIEKDAINVVEASAQAAINSMNGKLGGVLEEFNVAARMVSGGKMSDEQLLHALEATSGKNDMYPNGIYLAKKDGTFFDAAGWVPEPDYDATTRDWYVEGLKNTEDFVFGEPYTDATTGGTVITAAMNVSAGIGQEAVIAADVPLDFIVDYVKELSFYNGKGYGFIIDRTNGQIVVENGREKGKYGISGDADSFYKNVAAIAAEGKESTEKVKGDHGIYFTNSMALEGTNWMLVCYTSEYTAIKKDVENLYKEVGIMALIILVFIAIVITCLIRLKSKQIEKVTMAIEKISEGDFAQELVIRSTDEIGVMTHSLDGFIIKMQRMIKTLREIGKGIYSQADQTMNMSGELAKSSSNQYNSMNEMIRTLEQLAKSIEEIAQGSTSLATNVGSTNERCKEANDVLMETVSLSESGRNEMREVKVSMDDIQKTIDELENAVEKVGENMKKVVSMADVIGDIASQTNLLSLNASIEAARAGEAGKGFAVVAQEIGNLAINSTKSVADIKMVTDGIGTLVEEMVEKMNQSVAVISGCSGVVDKTSVTFEDINQKVIDTKEHVLSIIGSIGELDQISQSLAAITEEQSASSEEMLATSELILDHSGRVKDTADQGEDSAQDLLKAVTDLEEILAFFQYN